MIKNVDVLIVGTGVAGLFCALHLPGDKRILMITKAGVQESGSFLAQGGICMLRGQEDYDSYFEDTMRAGHYENCKEVVDIMIQSSSNIIEDLVDAGVEFEQEGQEFVFTREGGHSKPRILFHKDITGEEITKKLLNQVKKLPNVTILEHLEMLDLVCEDNVCYGIICRMGDGTIVSIEAEETVLACGGVGGLYEHSTNYPHLTGDGLAIAMKHNVALENLDYVQIHPTTLYSRKPGRRFLISESVRGEGAVLYNAKRKRFVDELLPRDLLTDAIHRQMKKDKMPYVRLSMEHIPQEKIKKHFPNIYRHCLEEEGYDITKECIPVVPAQHYFMGGIKVDEFSKTSMIHLYAVGETSCNGAHGMNRLASNSLLESLVFAKRAAAKIEEGVSKEAPPGIWEKIDFTQYEDYDTLKRTYQEMIKEETERLERIHGQSNYDEAECR